MDTTQRKGKGLIQLAFWWCAGGLSEGGGGEGIGWGGGCNSSVKRGLGGCSGRVVSDRMLLSLADNRTDTNMPKHTHHDTRPHTHTYPYTRMHTAQCWHFCTVSRTDNHIVHTRTHKHTHEHGTMAPRCNAHYANQSGPTCTFLLFCRFLKYQIFKVCTLFDFPYETKIPIPSSRSNWLTLNTSPCERNIW